MARGSPRPETARYRSQSLEPCNLARISTLLKNPQMNIVEIQFIYQAIRGDCEKMEHVLSQIPMNRSAEGVLITDLDPVAKRLHVRQQTGYGILLMISLVLNVVLQTHKSSENDWLLLVLEADVLIDQVINLAEQAMQYRPLAASATPICLIVAWGVTDDVLKRQRLQELLDEYQNDFTSVRWQEQAIRVKTRLRTVSPGTLRAEPISIIIT